MYTYNGQPILDQSQLFSASDLAQIDREVMFGLARSQNIFFSPGYELSRGDAELSLYNHDFKDVYLAEKELDEAERAEFAKLSFIQQHRYLRYAKGAYHPWSVCLPLTTESHWQNKMSSEGKSVTEEAKRLFPTTIEKLYALPAFKSIGRICIFGIDPNQHVTCHRDLDPADWPINDELLMISPRGNKKFFVYDPETKTKHFVRETSRAYIFHDLNYHGCEPLPYFTYTIRIDGLYSDEFRASIKCSRAGADPKSFTPKKAAPR